MAEFAYNNAKNTNMRYMPFKLNCGYYLYISYKDDIDPYSEFKVANKLTKKLRNLMVIYRKNLQHAQKLQKQAHNKRTKLRSYGTGKKIWLNNKYIKIKCNQILELKFLGLFEFYT